MGYRRNQDEIDIWCEAWATTRRKIYGGTVLDKKMGRDALRAVILGRSQDGRQEPIYDGIAATVHRCWIGLPHGPWKLLLELHYVWKEIPATVKAPMVPLSIDAYWDELVRVKMHLSGYASGERHIKAMLEAKANQNRGDSDAGKPDRRRFALDLQSTQKSRKTLRIARS